MLYVQRQDYHKILAHCRKQLPQEACGLLAGRKDGENCQVEMVYLLTNMDHSEEHFSMDPREQFAALKNMREKNMELLGNFHSHPISQASPSMEDRRLAFDRGLRYLIASLSEKEPVLKVFMWQEMEMKEETLLII